MKGRKLDTLKGNRRRAAMSQTNLKRELALAPAPDASDLVPLDMVVESVPAPRSAKSAVSYQHTGFELGAL